MSTEATDRDRRGPGRWLGRLGWLAAGGLFSWLLLVDPLGIHPVDDWLVGGGEPAPAAESASEAVLWTCPMHPHILESEPGECPVCGMDLVEVRSDEAEAEPPDGEREVLFYRNPMDPTVTSSVPARDEMGMEYVPVYADSESGAADDSGIIRIDPTVVQNMNVLSEPAERRDLAHPIRTVGYLEYDQERMVTVTTKYSGWVEKVYVNYVGEPVRKGQPLFEIYSPELVQTEQELLSALEYAGKFEGTSEESRRRAEALVEAARTRLGYWDIAPGQIAELERTGRIFRTLKVVAPTGGLVMKRINGLEGMAVRPGMETFHIADLSSLWLSVEVFEDQVAWIQVGTPAAVTFTYAPGDVFRGTVRIIEPEFSEQTRTLRVKLEVPNPDGQLRSGMFATVLFEPVAVHQALTVPSQAVLRTGQRSVVVADLGGGRFVPREVVLGHEGGDYVEVLEGLEEGDLVVTSSQFLLDSEASLQEAIRKTIARRRAAAAGQAKPPEPMSEHDEHPMPQAPDQEEHEEHQDHQQHQEQGDAE